MPRIRRHVITGPSIELPPSRTIFNTHLSDPGIGQAVAIMAVLGDTVVILGQAQATEGPL
jgi:hypothetical protein